ncbi:MAG: hypothetical protein GY939_17900 [Actinomycetia bacterium]|nr:hypothetical protein [Actinomycetes bacterium]
MCSRPVLDSRHRHRAQSRPPARPSLALLIVVSSFLSGCGIFFGGDDVADSETPGWRRDLTTTSTTPAEVVAVTTSTGATTTSMPTSSPSSSGPTASLQLRAKQCAGLELAEETTAQSPFLSETSGVVSSATHPGVLWAHNDSGSRAAVVAVGVDGANLGAFALPLDSSVDIEDIALVDGMLYLADIGDNDQIRSEIAIYRFAEPDPSSPSPISEVETIRARYPDGAHDAEAFLIDPLSGQMIIIDKTFAISAGAGGGGLLAPNPATVWVASPPFGSEVTLEQAGTIALDQLATLTSAPAATSLAGQLGVGGLATGADVRADGELIAVRTYDTVWLFERSPGQSVADALAGQPCEAPTRPEEQGEAVGFLGDTSRAFVTIAEGRAPTINITTEQE